MNKSYTTICGFYGNQPIEFQAINDWLFDNGITGISGFYRFDDTLNHDDITYDNARHEYTVPDELLTFILLSNNNG